MIWVTIKSYLNLILAGLFALITGGFFYQKHRANKKDDKINDLKEEMQADDINNEIKNFEAINRERKDTADEKLDKELNDLDHKLNDNSTY